MTLKGKTIVLGVTGSVAAYKACEIVRKLKDEGARVKVIMTESATRFITPLTLRTLSGETVTTSLFEEKIAHPLYHISLAEEADLVLVAPATANFIAKAAAGIADDILTTTVLAARSRVIVAPAMNERMYLNRTTQENITSLKERGFRLVGPVKGKLAEGEGLGRLSDVEDIVAAVEEELSYSQDLKGKNVIVTAGGTREKIDEVRFLSNYSSGKMGYALAQEAERRGAKVTLISAPTDLFPPAGVSVVRITSAEQMRREVLKRFPRVDLVLMAAAVADFKPASLLKGKVKRTSGLKSLALTTTPDILGELGAKKKKQILCGFAAETKSLIANARAKLKSKNLDLIVGNDVGKPGVGFGSDYSEAVIINREGKVTRCGRIRKEKLARIILDTVKHFW